MKVFSIGALALLGVCAAAQAQVVNGDFETGDFTGWTIGFTANGATSVQIVESFDVDGPGPLTDSLAGKFGVGNATTPNQLQQGVNLTQSVGLTAGTQYTLSVDWAAVRISTTNNADGGRFALVVDGIELAFIQVGDTSANMPHYGSLSAPFTPAVTGPHTVGIQIARRFLPPGDLFQYVDNFKVDGGTTPCYPDCDGDSSLTLADFGCFQTKFALADPYADCNGDGQLNLADFGCFQTSFAQGCP